MVRSAGWPTVVRTFRTKRDAEDWARRTEDEIVRGRYIERETADRIRFADALERLRAGNAQLNSKDQGGLSLKVSEKGAVSPP